MRIIFSRILAILLLVTVMSLVGWLFYKSSENPDTPAEIVTSSRSPLDITDLSYSNYLDDQLASRISVQRLSVRPRGFGILKIRSVNELFLEKAKFEFYEISSAGPQDNEAASSALGGGLAASLRGIADLRGVGRVTRGMVDDMQLIIHRRNKTTLRVHAKDAELDFKKRQTRMNDATLSIPEEQYLLRSKQIVWDDRKKLFVVPGDYVLNKAAVQKTGTGLVLNFGL